jgi:nucleoside-diphosphate-sugar epimerase
MGVRASGGRGMRLRTMRIFLAGATGAIGSLLVPRLVREHEVVATTRKPELAKRLAEAGATARIVDVYDREALFAAVRDARPEVVIHQLTDLAGGDTNANAALRTKGTRNLVDAARAAGVPRMVAQSIAWMYAPGEGPAVETDPLDLAATGPRKVSVDGVAALEAAVAEMPAFVILRYGTLHGPGTWYAPGALMAERARRGELVADDAVTSFLHVADAAGACLHALGPVTGTFNVCDDEPAAARAWLPIFARWVGAPEPKLATGGPSWARGANNDPMKRALGFTPANQSWRHAFQPPKENEKV